MSSFRSWSPTLPTIGGRLAPRVSIPSHIVASGYAARAAYYYLERNSSSNIFVKRVDNSWLRKRGHVDLIGSYLRDLPGPVLFKYLLGGLPTMSNHFQRKLSKLCLSKGLNTIQQWYYTVDGLVLPILFTEDDPDLHFKEIDKLIKFGFENCANNYSLFISRMKSLKRLLRRDLATGSQDARKLMDLSTYRKLALSHIYKDGITERRQLQVCLCWTQTRATGLADQKMVYRSLKKAELTLSTPKRVYPSSGLVLAKSFVPGTNLPGEPKVPRVPLNSVTRRVVSHIRGETAHLSAGPKACFEVPQHLGGQTGYIKHLAKSNVLYRVYDFETLDYETIVPRPCKSSTDLLSWAIQEAHERPTHTRCVRLCAIPEPSKARTVTVGTLPYQLILGAVAKILQPAIVSGISRTGLRSSRNLYEFLNQDLNPTDNLWAIVRDMKPKDEPIYGLSSDLEEATDYGDLSVARQILQSILSNCRGIIGFPMGLAVLAKTLYLGKRFCFLHMKEGVRYFIKRSGWLMGDRLTKVILTLSHEIGVLRTGIALPRICGDDVTALSRDRKSLEGYRKVMEDLGFKISDEDHFVSSKFLFYCEEASLVPQVVRDLPSVCNRRKVPSCYVDYPRIRLLLPVKVETQSPSYTDIGRFSLLGKETRWTHQNGDHVDRDLFNRATLLQHMIVPQPSDTICPFIPHELAGDGAFPLDGNFLLEVVQRKSRSPQKEVSFRLHQLITGKWGFRYVRSDILDNVIHKYHMMVPKVKILEELLPQEAVVRASEKMLGSLKVPDLESPEKVFLRTWRAYYWHCILNGLEEPVLDLTVPRLAAHCGGSADLTSLSLMQDFHHLWAEVGFTFQDKPDYLVYSKRIQVYDHLALPFSFERRQAVPDPSRGMVQESHIEDFIRSLQGDGPIPAVIQDRLHLYVEADSYICFTVSKWWVVPRYTVLVSNDKKLAIRIAEILVGICNRLGGYEIAPMVITVSPNDYMYGWMSHHTDPLGVEDVDYKVVVDFGQLNYLAFVDDPVFHEFEDIHIEYSPIYRKPSGVSDLVRKSRIVGRKTSQLWSLTSQPLSTFHGRATGSARSLIQRPSELSDPKSF